MASGLLAYSGSNDKGLSTAFYTRLLCLCILYSITMPLHPEAALSRTVPEQADNKSFQATIEKGSAPSTRQCRPSHKPNLGVNFKAFLHLLHV